MKVRKRAKAQSRAARESTRYAALGRALDEFSDYCKRVRIEVVYTRAMFYRNGWF